MGPPRCSYLNGRTLHFQLRRDNDAIFEIQPIYTGNRYPATSALFQIGKPAVPALLRVIARHESNSREAKNARYTVRVTFRGDSSGADNLFKEAAAKARTPEARQRLLKALETAQEDCRAD
jgi:hypothetical protein